ESGCWLLILSKDTPRLACTTGAGRLPAPVVALGLGYSSWENELIAGNRQGECPRASLFVKEGCSILLYHVLTRWSGNGGDMFWPERNAVTFSQAKVLRSAGIAV